jgi:SAM-dependent methyltransferase
MTGYGILLLPSANRVYADAAVELTLAELAVFNATVLGGRLDRLAADTIAGVPYVTFDAPDLTERDLAYLANASSRYALFERQVSEGQGELLRPVPLRGLDVLDDDLVTIPKYAGKTNEQFTKLLLNITLLASDSAGRMLDAKLRVLDPLCGRGTTLNQALTYGYDASGIDLDGKDFDLYVAYLQTYLKRKRLKHRADVHPVRREKKLIGRRCTVTLSPSREADPLSLDVVHADTTTALEFFKKDTFDVVVADAPYGVHHGSRTVAAGLKRTPLELLREAAPVWARLMRPGAALGLSWNTHVARRDEAAALLAKADLTVLDGPWDRFEHRVDQSIQRDVLVAVKR